MADLLFIAIVIAFFGLARLLVKVCDHIIGPEESAVSAADQRATEEAEVAA
jgi:hypothetical protein